MLPSSIKHYNHRYTSQSSFLVLKIGTLVVWLVVNLSAKRHALLINTTPKSFTIKSTYSIRILDFSIVSCLIRSWTFHIVRCKLLFIGFIFYIFRSMFNMMGSILDFSLVPRILVSKNYFCTHIYHRDHNERLIRAIYVGARLNQY